MGSVSDTVEALQLLVRQYYLSNSTVILET